MNTHNLNIKLDMQNQMFFVMVKGGAAFLKFQKPERDIIDIRETYVPEPSRNNGVAEELVDQAAKYAASKNYRIIPSCPVVKSLVKDNPNYKEVVEQ